MKLGIYTVALIVGLGLAAPAIAQSEPAKDEPAKPAGEAAPAPEAPKEEAAKPAEAAPAAEAPEEEAAKPAEEAAPAAKPAADTPAAAVPAVEAAPAAKPAMDAPPAAAPTPAAVPAKELSSGAKPFVPLADSYKTAYDDMQKWIGQIDAQTAAVSDKAQKLQTQIQQNETAITQAKLDKNDSKAKSLQKENKKLWDDFNAAKKELSTISAGFTKEASSRVKQYADASAKALEGLKSQK
jgi:hypothetical protein